jgi:aminoglycoside phosphotransferase (APT) family kinase protein
MHAYCSDLGVIGRPFLVQECIDGVSITDTLPEGYEDPIAATNALGIDMVTQLAAVHNIAWPDPSLSGLGKPEHFIERQIERWLKIRKEQAVRPLPKLFELGQWLRDNVPPVELAALTHGDYHLDNTLADTEAPSIKAIIDWELATVGEPAMDVALALLFWGEKRVPQPPGFAHLQAISRRPGVIDRRELAKIWSINTGRSLDHMDYFMALAAWRLAAIVEGAYCLFTEGKVSTRYAASLEYDVPALLVEAQHAAEGDW